MVGVPARREQVAYARRRGLSQRRSCTLLGVARSALGYLSTKAEKDAPVLARMAALGAQYPRFGYRRIRIFLEREGHGMSWGRAWRLWRRARLQVPRRRPRKRIASGRPRPQAPTGANQVWSYDFVFDWCANGQQLKCLTVTDEWTKEGLAIEVDGRLRSGRVIEVLSRLVSERGAPRYLRSDNGPEFVARALLEWIVDQGIETALIDPGKPWQNVPLRRGPPCLRGWTGIASKGPGRVGRDDACTLVDRHRRTGHNTVGEGRRGRLYRHRRRQHEGPGGADRSALPSAREALPGRLVANDRTPTRLEPKRRSSPLCKYRRVSQHGR